MIAPVLFVHRKIPKICLLIGTVRDCRTVQTSALHPHIIKCRSRKIRTGKVAMFHPSATQITVQQHSVFEHRLICREVFGVTI